MNTKSNKVPVPSQQSEWSTIFTLLTLYNFHSTDSIQFSLYWLYTIFTLLTLYNFHSTDSIQFSLYWLYNYHSTDSKNVLWNNVEVCEHENKNLWYRLDIKIGLRLSAAFYNPSQQGVYWFEKSCYIINRYKLIKFAKIMNIFLPLITFISLLDQFLGASLVLDSFPCSSRIINLKIFRNNAYIWGLWVLGPFQFICKPLSKY
jgi:hypothetical protein